MNTSNTTRRSVIGNISVSLDGRTTGNDGPYDMGWIVPHAITDTARAHLLHQTTATTALLGRKNYQGFGGYWPTVANDPAADPRDRQFAHWLDTVEKVVVSTTLTEPTWQNSRIVHADPATVVRELREQPGGDIVVLNSVSVINALLHGGELDRLTINLCPELVGGGDRLFRDGLPTSSWTLTNVAASDTGAVMLTYDINRH
jgi:dihydrofolate reductase